MPHAVQRDLRALADTTFDVLVIGAGIYGVTTAWEASRRGLRVALIDRGDIGAATSANSLKTIHGGLRSLQRGALKEMRAFIRERRALLRIAPHLVRPLPFVIPTSRRHPVRNGAAMRIALLLNDLIASDRNDGLLPSHRLGGGRLLTHAQLGQIAPDLDPRTYTGGATWWDGQMLNSERLALAFAQSVAAMDGVVANHVGADRLLVRDGRVEGARVRDVLGGGTFDIRASVTVNAAGAWAAGLSDEALGQQGTPLAPLLSRALNVVVPRPSRDTDPAVGGLSDGRFFFRVPWRGVTMFGTSHEPFTGHPDEARPAAADVQRLLDDVNKAFPGAPVTFGEVTLVHWGILPAARVSGLHVDLLKDSLLRDHRTDGLQGLVTVVGVRYTTARQTGALAASIAHAQLPASRGRRVDDRDLPCLVGGDVADFDALSSDLARLAPALRDIDVRRLCRTYGSRAPALLDVMRSDAAWAAPLSATCPVTRAEITYAAREEMALTLADALVRRTEAGSAGHPGRNAVEAAADVLARVHGWDAARRVREVMAVDAYYAPARANPAQLHPVQGVQ